MAFHPRQLAHSSGGPRDIALLYTEEMIAEDLPDLETLELHTCETILAEGPFHTGTAEVVRSVGRMAMSL